MHRPLRVRDGLAIVRPLGTETLGAATDAPSRTVYIARCAVSPDPETFAAGFDASEGSRRYGSLVLDRNRVLLWETVYPTLPEDTSLPALDQRLMTALGTPMEFTPVDDIMFPATQTVGKPSWATLYYCGRYGEASQSPTVVLLCEVQPQIDLQDDLDLFSRLDIPCRSEGIGAGRYLLYLQTPVTEGPIVVYLREIADHLVRARLGPTSPV